MKTLNDRPARCECPDSGVFHAAHGCRNLPTRYVIRGGKRGATGAPIWVCGDCILSKDIDLTIFNDDYQPIGFRESAE